MKKQGQATSGTSMLCFQGYQHSRADLDQCGWTPQVHLDYTTADFSRSASVLYVY